MTCYSVTNAGMFLRLLFLSPHPLHFHLFLSLSFLFFHYPFNPHPRGGDCQRCLAETAEEKRLGAFLSSR